LGDLAVVVGAAFTVTVTDLADRRHVDGVVEATVAATREPVDLAWPGGHLDRCGAVVGGEGVTGREADTSPTSPMTVAATIGPTPNRVVSVVLEAVTAAVIRRLASRCCSSRRLRSATSSTASSCRTAATAPAASMSSSRRVA